jgi:ribonuclease-3
MLSSDVPHSVFPLSINGLGEVRLSVRSDEAAAALELIASHRDEFVRGHVIPLRERLHALEQTLGYRFRSRDLLERALTHRSHANEEGAGQGADNESLEFLGDAVLGFVVADTLFRDFPDHDEGQKSKTKSLLVSTSTLAGLASGLGLGEHLMLGRGEEKTGGRYKQALLADAFEAVLGAVYLDGGIDAARRLVLRQVGPLLEQVRQPGFWGRDYKSTLQEYLQARDFPLPVYAVTAERGPDHRKLFEVDVRVRGETIAQARGRSKKEAEQEGARLALERFAREQEPPAPGPAAGAGGPEGRSEETGKPGPRTGDPRKTPEG